MFTELQWVVLHITTSCLCATLYTSLLLRSCTCTSASALHRTTLLRLEMRSPLLVFGAISNKLLHPLPLGWRNMSPSTAMWLFDMFTSFLGKNGGLQHRGVGYQALDYGCRKHWKCGCASLGLVPKKHFNRVDVISFIVVFLQVWYFYLAIMGTFCKFIQRKVGSTSHIWKY